MLKLTLTEYEWLHIGEHVRIACNTVTAHKVCICIDAPKEVSIQRESAHKKKKLTGKVY